MFGPFPITGLIPTVPKEKQRDITIPVSMWIIDHPKGLVVFDTGNNVAISDGNCKAYWAAGTCDFLKPSQKREDVIDMQLKKLGYSADKVKIVVTSHTHLDHGAQHEAVPERHPRHPEEGALPRLVPGEVPGPYRPGPSCWPIWKARATSTSWNWKATMTCSATAPS